MMKLILMLFMLMPVCVVNFYIFGMFLFWACFLMLLSCNFSYLWIGVSFNFGVDCLSYCLIILSIWVSGLMIIASTKISVDKKYPGVFSLSLLFLLLSLVFVFCSLNLMLFYIFFEISLIPLLFIILGWGYQPERLLAGMYLMFYTLLFSLPMMVALFYIYFQGFSLMIFNLGIVESGFMYMLIVFVFLVKMPMFMIHLWLPKAHVEAPVAGSMILAGVMLKLGGYGLIRFLKLFMYFNYKINMVILTFSIMGGVIISVLCMFQVDMKSLIAYSSVSHMSLVLGGILTFNSLGFLGGFIMMIAHGLCSSGLFVLANIYYERFNSRSMYMLKGLINLFPGMCFWMFMLCISNMAAPPSLNLVGEIILLGSLISYNYMYMIPLSFLSFMGACYSIYLFSYSQHGKLYSNSFSCFSSKCQEYMLLFLHWFPLNVMILFSDMFVL
uniref:NADH-ubiquinone oxidoreductase chain 4 n=1 Tax=Brontispa longissima TaxID=111217 RepID=A0A7T8ZST2_BROLO|nr:NADH dehydrogenase subunit 4 [Brontispa longissima]QQQ89068.1 NADH dehydrogenase subunit 4 [Brontispa longissima]UAJ48101.1 NADH dehydrogenase subunit 4 [Brontispa longissima]URQ17584.1 NADH dehydrogenase subunit 4 [Brontispa longissima]